MADKYKIKISKAYYIAIEDKDGYEVASDWSFLDYKETKKIAEKMLAEAEREKSDAEKQVDELLKSIESVRIEIVRKLPKVGDRNTIYRKNGIEWIWFKDDWVRIG